MLVYFPTNLLLFWPRAVCLQESRVCDGLAPLDCWVSTQMPADACVTQHICSGVITSRGKFVSVCVSMCLVSVMALRMAACVFKECVNVFRIRKVCLCINANWELTYGRRKQCFLMTDPDQTPLLHLRLGPVCSLGERSVISESSIKALAQLTARLPSIRAIDWLAAACW